MTRRRLFGIDRSGPPPDATRTGQPLNPWTIPNAIGYLRLGCVVAYLIVALASRDGRATAALVLFAVAGFSDYADGFAARLTGQYSRLGMLLDPIVDRALVISGMIVCWEFHLLPRWAIAVVIGREMVTLALSRFAIKQGVELSINWVGRVGVAPAFGAPFFAMAGVHAVALVMLYAGMVMGLLATGLYVQSGLRHASAEKVSS